MTADGVKNTYYEKQLDIPEQQACKDLNAKYKEGKDFPSSFGNIIKNSLQQQAEGTALGLVVALCVTGVAYVFFYYIQCEK